MQKLLNRPLLILVAVTLLSACAGRKTQEIYGPGYPTPPSSPPEIDLPEAGIPMGAPGSNDTKSRPRVALVLGGAGVASFATVGLLKRFREEGIRFDFVVASGWAAPFALGNCYLRSVHDLEWFAMRLDESDFRDSGFFKRKAGSVSSKFEKAFGNSLEDCKTPLTISFYDRGELVAENRGSWKEPLIHAIALEGLVPETEKADASHPLFSGMDVREAIRNDAEIVVAVQMYDDFLSTESATSSGLSKPARKKLKAEMKQTDIQGRIVMAQPPMAFGGKRAAIRAGYKEAGRLVKKIRGAIANRQ